MFKGCDLDLRDGCPITTYYVIVYFYTNAVYVLTVTDVHILRKLYSIRP